MLSVIHFNTRLETKDITRISRIEFDKSFYKLLNIMENFTFVIKLNLNLI